ncbi:tetratricopeptide repeat protein [Dokdonella fugitiva]|jgi:hypothetical protein|uniref:Sel1 repeat-containing protein n=1 Tax=Dokdonella fugitiva TaxID=328517 RepID=A0A4R2I6Z5_9GAMM|nr:SEL1-like repeat protein [Dokdonella fugitiva]MBA8884435.1 hypothetical protein [Dokdonella fugitiva]TCO40034.1 Sel1 repeat-containing protein [Dokdonella fugitiva]
MNLRAMWLSGSILLSAAAAAGDDLPPRYDSRHNVERPASSRYATPEDKGRPGEKFYFDAVRAIAGKDYSFAINMYEVSASWAYKPAQYNLGVIYLKGEGVPVDRPRAMAWFALAAERGDADYVQARELLYADLDKDEFAQANAIWRELKPKYGDAVALARAKMRWAQVKAEQTGSRVGAPGNLKVGSVGSSVRPVRLSPSGRSEANGFASSAFGVLGGSSEDGSTAYRQFRESDNPYDPKFEWRSTPTPEGTVVVDPLLPAAANGGSDGADTPPARTRFH